MGTMLMVNKKKVIPKNDNNLKDEEQTEHRKILFSEAFYLII